MSRYRKIDPRMWGDERFRELSKPQPNAQTLFVYLLTGPHTSRLPGLYHVGRAALAEALGWSLEAFGEAFAEASEQLEPKPMVKADWEARVVWIPNALKYNPPESPNVLRAWLKDVDDIPECSLRTQFLSALKALAEGMGEGYAEAFWEALPEPMPESGAGTGAGTGTGAGERGREEIAAESASCDLVIDYLNEVAGGRFRHSDVSRKFIRARLGEGAVIDDCKLVVDHKAAQWLGDPEMEPHLNPETLFRPTKFEKNLSAAIKWHEQGRPPIGPRASERRRASERDAVLAWVGGEDAQ